MAKNMKSGLNALETFALAVSHPAVPVSGDPVRFGGYCGLALNNEGADGMTVVHIGRAEVEISVKGVDGAGNSAVALFDKLYYTDADTPVINKKNTGTFFGIALDTVGSGATKTIRVLKAGF